MFEANYIERECVGGGYTGGRFSRVVTRRRGSSAVALLPLGGSSFAVRVWMLMGLMLLSGVLGVLWSSPAYAEGSKELSAQGGDRAFLWDRTSGGLSSFGGIAARSEIRVYATQGERIWLASSAQGLGSGRINYVSPTGVAGSCAVNGSVGLIQSRAEEVAGPSANGAGATYQPCEVVVPAGQGGVWKVTFVSPNPTSTSNIPVGVTASANWTQSTSQSYIAAWDVTVRNAANTATTTGRTYANYLSQTMGLLSTSTSVGRRNQAEVLVQTREGFRFRYDYNGLDPLTFITFANDSGFRDSSGNTLYKSVQLSSSDAFQNGQSIHNPGSADTASDVTYKMFINTPANDLPASANIASGGGGSSAATTWLVNSPAAAPVISNFSFTGTEGTPNQAAPGQGGNFEFTLDKSGPYRITLDLNNDGTIDNANDRVLVGEAQSGQTTVQWDGKDGSGNTVSASSAGFSASVAAYAGQIHFPLLDPENNASGTILQRTVPTTSDTVYYDDTGLTGGTPPVPLRNLGGESSATGSHEWSNTYGDHKGIDTWAYATGNTSTLASNIEIKAADLAVTKTDNRTNLGSGDTISYDIQVTNNGPSAISGATLTDAAPTGISNVTWNCQITTGTGACGTANGTSGDIQTSLDLANGAVATITVNGTVANDAPATLTNTANVARPNDVSDPNSANNSATDNTNVNRAPNPQDDTATTNEETQTVIDVRLNDADPDTGQTLTITNVGNPANGTAQLITSGADSGKIRYTPNANFDGTNSFTYTLCDNGTPQRCAQATVTVTVNPVNDPPQITLPGGALNYTENDAPTLIDANATATDIDSANLDTGTLTIDFSANGAAQDRLAIRDQGTAAGQIGVSGSNVTYGGTTIGTFTGGTGTTPLVITFNSNATPAAAQALERNITYANVSENPSTASRTVRFILTDGDGGTSNTATKTINVTAVNDAPVAVNNSYSVNEDGTLTVPDGATDVLGNDTDVENGTLTVAAPRPVSGPSNGTLTLNANGSFTYTPNANFNGSDSFTYRATDGSAQSNLATVTITVNPVNDAPMADNDTASTQEDIETTIDVLTNDTDPEGNGDLDPASVSVTSGPSNGTTSVDPQSGEITYTPDADFNGTDTFTYEVCDDANPALCDEATVTVTVSSVNDDPVAVNDTANANEDGNPVSIDVLDNDTDGPDTGETLSIQSVTQPPSGEGSVAIVQGQNGDPDEVRYTPNADFFGQTTFTYTISDGNGGTDTATVNVTVKAVNDTPVAEDDTATTDEDESVVIDVLANDRDADGRTNLDPASVRVVNDPANGTTSVNQQTGEITYNPDANYNGSDEFTYEVCDRNQPPACSNPARVTVTINPVNDAPTATDRTFDAVEDTTLTVSVADGILRDARDADGDPLTAELVTDVPANTGTLTLNPDGSFEFVPAEDFNGDVIFSFEACDDATPQACSETRTVTLRVAPRNDAPEVQEKSVTTPEDTERTITLTATDVDGDDVTFSVPQDSGPTKGSLGEIGTVNCTGTSPRTCTAEVTYTPDANYNGPDSIEYVADDGDDTSAPATVDIDVTPVNDAPVASDDSYSTPEDTKLTVAVADGVLQDDNDVDGDTLTAELVSGPGSGTLDLRDDGSFTYDPAPNFAGEVTFTYRALDGKGGFSEPATVTISVSAQNDPPNLDLNGPANGVDDAVLFTEDSGPIAVDGGSDASVSDLDDENMESATVRIANLLDGNKESLSADAGQTGIEVSYDAATGVLSLDGSATKAQYESVLRSVRYENTSQNPSTADRRIEFVVNDGGADSNVATSVVSIAARNDAPTADDESAATDEDTPVTIDVLDGDTDPEGDSLTVTVKEADRPANGTVEVDGQDRITYTPNADYNGPDEFTYTISDGNGGEATAKVSITVRPINDAPVADEDSYEATEDTLLTVPATEGVLDGDTDVENDELSAAVLAGPNNGTLTLNSNGSFEYRPNENFTGEDTFTYTVSDGNGGTDTETVRITVEAVNDTPVAVADIAATDEDTPVEIDVLENDTDVENDELTITEFTNGANGTVSRGPDGTLVYTPNPDFNGTDTFTYTITDGESGETATVTVTVRATNDAPVAENDAYSVNEDETLAVEAANGLLANDADPDRDPLTAKVVEGPEEGTLMLETDGSFTYRPDDNFNGTDTFTYQACDDADVCSETRTVTLTVNGVNDAPMASDDSYSVDEDGTLTIETPGILGNDTDVDGNQLTAAVVDGPTNGTLTPNADGSFTYTPNEDFNGEDSFTYKASDNDIEGNLATVRITVSGVNDVPVANDDAYDAVEDTQLEVSSQDGVLENDADADGDRLTAELVQGPDPSRGTLALSPDGSFSFEPAPDFDGTVTFTYEACEEANPNVCSEPVTVTINVAVRNDAPVVRDDSGSTGEAAAVGNAFISQYASTKSKTPTRLYQFNTTQSPYTLDKVGADIARPMNAIGYRSTDLSLYGYRMVKSPGIVKVDPETGAARYLGKPRGLPTSTGYIAGDVSPDGSTYYLYANKARVLWKVDLNTFQASSVKLSSTMNVADFAVSPDDGNLYGVAKDGKLLQIDPRTGRVTAGSVAGLEPGTYGAAWFTAAGDLIVYENGTSNTSGTLVWIARPDTAPSVVSTKAGPATRGNDGAAYVADPDPAGLSVVVDVLANDEDPDGALDRNTLQIDREPDHGTVTINADKTITYTSDSSYSGTDSFRYKVCDNGGQCGIATVNITSEPV